MGQIWLALLAPMGSPAWCPCLVARPLDRWPKGRVIVGMTGLTAAFTAADPLAFGERHTAATALLGTGAVCCGGLGHCRVTDTAIVGGDA